jgi:Amt family ammonium transporter
LFFDRIKIDDPVGAISVHLVCGIWGTLAVGIFGELAGPSQLWNQFVGVVAYGAATFAFAASLFLIIRATMGLRVDPEEEMEGLDMAEHGMHAYPDFPSVSVMGGHVPPASSGSAQMSVAADYKPESVLS